MSTKDKVNTHTTPRSKDEVAKRTATRKVVDPQGNTQTIATPDDAMAAILAASGGVKGKGKVAKGRLSTVACPGITDKQDMMLRIWLTDKGLSTSRAVGGVLHYAYHGFAPMPLLIAYAGGTRAPLYFQLHHLGVRVREGTMEKWGKPNPNHKNLLPRQTFNEYINSSGK